MTHSLLPLPGVTLVPMRVWVTSVFSGVAASLRMEANLATIASSVPSVNSKENKFSGSIVPSNMDADYKLRRFVCQVN